MINSVIATPDIVKKVSAIIIDKYERTTLSSTNAIIEDRGYDYFDLLSKIVTIISKDNIVITDEKQFSDYAMYLYNHIKENLSAYSMFGFNIKETVYKKSFASMYMQLTYKNENLFRRLF